MGQLEQGQTVKAPARCLAHPMPWMGLWKEETSSGPDSREQSLQGGRPGPQRQRRLEGRWPEAGTGLSPPSPALSPASQRPTLCAHTGRPSARLSTAQFLRAVS